MVLLHRLVVDRHAGIVDRLVDHAERVGLRRPAEIVDRLGPVALPGSVDLVDRADLARLWLGDELLVVEPPPGRRIAAERLAGIGRVGAWPRLHVDDAHFEDIAGLGAADIDRAGADVHAETLAGAAAEQLAVDRAGAAAVDALLLLGPEKHAFGAGIALDHALGVVIGVMGERLDGDVVAGIDLEPRLEQLAEIAPMHGVGGRREIVIGRLARPRLRRGRLDQRAAARRQGCGAATRHERALEKAAPFRVEIVEELLAMQLELRTIVVVACAHGGLLGWRNGIPCDRRGRGPAGYAVRRAAARSPRENAIGRPANGGGGYRAMSRRCAKS